ncbi:hypothetical protein [Brucella sp. NBRC 12950]|uniref:hypothetical protein n=1 Tax=Brucella sp. NBRC 12950 TaxID=2994518 RepID=UPI0024A5E9AA|nr:hypothetical protein [Brucella sp. NBRC 12950]GLU28000.1 hypothetical protein Brsp01_32330 [Brucella sp. NBRC 12950]
MNFSRNKSTLALIAAGVGGAAVAGFGLSMGRDIYKGAKKNSGNLLLLLSVIFCPFIGGRELVRGHDRGVLGTFFITYIGSILLIAIGFISASILAFEGLAVTSKEAEAGGVMILSIIIGAAVTAFLAGIGLLVGFYQRSKRLHAFAVKRHNERFLTELGFKETDGKDITHYAPDGQGLRFLEAHPGKLVFMAVGKRGKRAFIDLDEDGKMKSYTGIV